MRKFLTCAVLVFTLSVLATAQEAPKAEVFGGFSYLHLDTKGAAGVEANHYGWNAALSLNANRWFGITADLSGHYKELAPGVSFNSFTAVFGPQLTYRAEKASPFVHALFGVNRASTAGLSDSAFAMALGGGLDINITKRLAFRLVQADYLMTKHADDRQNNIRLSTGLVLKLGGGPPPAPASAACSVQPSEVFAGEPVTATANGSNFNPKRTVKYAWSGTGVKVSGSSASTQIDTTGLAPGSYQVQANLSDGSTKGVASCNARFTVRQPNPPTISCSANPETVQPSGTSTINSRASSPDSRRLTYSYTASAGSVTGNTSAATLDSTGAQPGTITVTCNVSDDRNLTATSTTMVYVQAPPRPEITAIERRLALHSIYFATAKPTEENPDAGLLASQEQTLSTLASDFRTYLQSKPEARLTLEGHTDPRGSVEYNQGLSERRVDRTKRFLVEQGVPAANIETKAFGEQQNLTDAEVRDAVEKNPELSAADRTRILKNMRTIILASNRRVDITLTNAGQAVQESVREYPFNAADSLTLLDTRGGTGLTARPAVKKKPAKKQ